MRTLSICSGLLLLLALAGCQSNSKPPTGVKIGKPYDIDGKTYYPAYDPTYDKEGMASWYGPGFHGKSTANGETFDTHDLTAAHPTLPMPSLVRVTNLENGKMIVVRINDRGPFARNRIIDLSKASAQRLGIKGLAKVRVQYLVDESNQYIAAVKEGRNIDMVAYNDQLESKKSASLLAATAPSDSTFIIEENNNTSRYDSAVNDAAPVMSVSGSDLQQPSSKKLSHNIFVREAFAGDERQPAVDQPMTVAEEISKVPSKRGGEVVLRSPSMKRDEPMYAEKPVVKQVAPVMGGGFYIQVGSFSQKINADAMKNKIAGFGPVDVGSAEISGHSWWRVRSGPFATEADADIALEKIRNNGAPDARKVRQ
jgi:rare lipoprotein A